MQLLFIADPIASFKIYKDTTFAMMREAQARGHVLWVCEAADLHWRGGNSSTPTLATGGEEAIAAPVTAVCRRIELTGATSGHDWYRVLDQRPLALREVDAVLMRKDPPFDSEYFYATHLLQQAEREGAAVFNSPRALRDHPEKLAILEFPQFITPTLVSRRAAEIKAFYGEHGDVILKPLDGMGGTGIFR
ncbi:MAG: glutathione synthase, partial [Betaproteobacteria bacterium]|nr:glutathione synthase [Betaproteobacteria bacterium]